MAIRMAGVAGIRALDARRALAVGERLALVVAATVADPLVDRTAAVVVAARTVAAVADPHTAAALARMVAAEATAAIAKRNSGASRM
jgi:hypothetical protein